MPTALIVGKSGVSPDPVLEFFRRRTRQLGYDPEEEPAYAHVVERCNCLDRNGKLLILFCVHESLAKTDTYLAKIRGSSRRVIVYAHVGHASSHEAIDYLDQGLAHGYLVNGDSPSEENMDVLVTSLRAGQGPHYPAIDFKQPQVGVSPGVFVSTPFERSTLQVARNAIDYPLKRLGFQVFWGDRDYWRSVPDTIINEIRSSSLLVANVSLDPRNLLHNVNVYFEAGAATALGLPIIYVRKASEQGVPLPADVQGRRWLSYDNEIDLAIKLYSGLKHAIQARSVAPGPS